MYKDADCGTGGSRLELHGRAAKPRGGPTYAQPAATQREASFQHPRPVYVPFSAVLYGPAVYLLTPRPDELQAALAVLINATVVLAVINPTTVVQLIPPNLQSVAPR